MAQEFQRTCMACQTVWHTLVARERELERSQSSNALSEGLYSCGCRPGASMQARRNKEQSATEIASSRRCPKCGSANYQELIVDHTQHGPQTR